jgi:hypothetical protein
MSAIINKKEDKKREQDSDIRPIDVMAGRPNIQYLQNKPVFAID